ncbi:MAG TPA: GWxTD domain-containing protein [Bryobacteraceae bacterium]|jgi:GWxTD domain-containing protein
MRTKPILALCSLCSLFLASLFLIQSGARAQDSTKAGDKKSATQGKTVAKPQTEKQRKAAEAKLKKELETPYKKWENEEVIYIISEEERKAFGRLQTDEEREQFIEQFWLRRDPTPDTEENEFKEEHYRRIAYANETFTSGNPGWKMDRGMIYIKYGAPDEREEHPSGGTYDRPIEEGGGTTTVYPFEKWRYRYLEGMGNDVNIEFVDPSMTGEYHMTMDPSEKDALTNVPGAGLTMYEQLGLACKSDRFTRTDGTRLGTGQMPLPASMDQFTRLEQFANLQRPPATKYKDLEALVNSSIKYNLIPSMRVRVDYIPITDTSVYTNVTVQFDRHDLSFKDNKEGFSSFELNIFGRVTNMTRRSVNNFDENLTQSIPTEMVSKIDGKEIFQKQIPLPPGKYRLSVAATDRVGGNKQTQEIALDVPRLDDDRLSTSSLILADVLEKVPTTSVGKEPFVIGATKVRPKMDATFSRKDTVGIYMKLYNFDQDETTRKAEGTVECQVVKAVSGEVVAEFTQNITKPQDIIEQWLHLTDFEPGPYSVKMKVTDHKRNQTLTPSANFTVN